MALVTCWVRWGSVFLGAGLGGGRVTVVAAFLGAVFFLSDLTTLGFFFWGVMETGAYGKLVLTV